MGRAIPIGLEFYKEFIDKDCFYVDKTMLIRDIVDSNTKVSLFTRPRRFGKTLSMTMLQAYFEDERDGEGNHVDNSRYFIKKKISECGDRYTNLQEQFPVISLTLKSAKQPNYDMARAVLIDEIRKEFGRHAYVLKVDGLDNPEKNRFQSIYEGTAAESDYVTALAFLSQCLKKIHGRNVIILIDEYDVPLENAYFEGFYDHMTVFIRSVFESALKTNSCLEFAVITGCLRISKESIFTGLNNLSVCSLLSDDYAEYYGFTTAEVESLLEECGISSCIDEVREWYDGYQFGQVEVYNPWSVINYARSKMANREAFPRPYWSNTSANSIVRDLVENADITVKREIESLIEGAAIEKPVHEDITYEDIHGSQDNLWNFLFFTGYLKKVAERRVGRNIYLQMAIPNEEIRHIYENMILSWFDRKIKTIDRMPLYQALVDGDCDCVETILKHQLMESISFFDGAENFYHGFMVGMLSGLGEYLIHSNKESGDGRADVIMEPLDADKPVLIFEFKRVDKFHLMGEKCEEALRQIEEKHYDAEYKETGYEHYVKYGICFCRKTCKVQCVVNHEREAPV